MYVRTVDKVPVLWVPLAPLVPVQSPLAVQFVGLFVADQVRFELPPEVVEIGFALSDTTGAGGSVTLTVAVATALSPP